MNTIKESKDMTKGEARFIQYSKIAMMLAFLLYLVYLTQTHRIIIQCVV